MRGNRLQLPKIVLGVLFVASGTQANMDVHFMPFSAAHAYDARVYRAIWDEYGERIVAALEARTCLAFPESSVWAIVAEAVSNSGGPEHPMRLRASYVRDVKKGTLVHELAHRHLWQLTERLDGIDGHRTLYLVLDRVWADVWGRAFAENQIRGESGWFAHFDYAAAWTWARALGSDERLRLWNRLLVVNGLPGDCRGLANAAE